MADTSANAAKPLSFQQMILRLHAFWAAQGCVILQPYDMRMGAGTFHPATTLRAVSPFAGRLSQHNTVKGALPAAAPCPVPVKQAMIDWWGPVLLEYYAGSEGNGMTFATSQDWLAHKGTVGSSIARRF